MIRRGMRYYPWADLPPRADLLPLLDAGRAIEAPQEAATGLWLTAEDYRGLRKRRIDPKVAAHIARQEGGCKGCGG